MVLGSVRRGSRIARAVDRPDSKMVTYFESELFQYLTQMESHTFIYRIPTQPNGIPWQFSWNP